MEFNRSLSAITSNDISIIVKHVNNHLKQLKFDKHFQIDSSVFLKEISACPNLQFLRLPTIENVQENFMQELNHKLKKLVHIHVVQDQVPSFFIQLSDFKQLHSVIIESEEKCRFYYEDIINLIVNLNKIITLRLTSIESDCLNDR